jgi:tetrahydromethanopterin S-methyltransferase subunit B
MRSPVITIVAAGLVVGLAIFGVVALVLIAAFLDQ